jgi:hypothetical protein
MTLCSCGSGLECPLDDDRCLACVFTRPVPTQWTGTPSLSARANGSTWAASAGYDPYVELEDDARRDGEAEWLAEHGDEDDE